MNLLESLMAVTEIYDEYWRFAYNRHQLYLNRLAGIRPWTTDPILKKYRFTNSYRVLDRVSQYLIREVQYRPDRPQAPSEVFFRTLLFKLFNKIETWEYLEAHLGNITWQSVDLDAVDDLLTKFMAQGKSIYSPAYIIATPAYGKERKHSNHIKMLEAMMLDGVPGFVARTKSAQSVYEKILSYSGMGPFLAFQYTVDLGYADFTHYDESEFVIAGPGAHDGISKCFVNDDRSAEDIIMHMVEVQDREFERLGLDFPGLFGRRLQPIDCQNLFCEISKYSRVSHPHIKGVSGRTKIKQEFQSRLSPLEAPVLPPKWNVIVPDDTKTVSSFFEFT